jgi:Fe-S cluster assembly protein SufD
MTTATAQHGLAEHSHGSTPGSSAPVQTRSDRPWSYDPADFAAPDRNDPFWRFIDLDRVASLLGEHPSARIAEGTFHPEDVVSASTLQAADPRHVLVDGTTRLVLGAQRAEHIVIEAPADSSGTVILQHVGTGVHGENVEILVGAGASLTVISLQEWEDDAVHLASHQAVVGPHASLKHIVVSLGGGVVRVNPSVRLAGDGAQAELYGLAFADAGQHLESQVFLHHEGRNTRGRVTYKGALQGESARTVWVGDVLIGANATGTDTYEQNRNLVLTEGARADSIPNLEIETGEIAGAGHASATGRFDDEQMFYLQARGIPEEEARRLVVLGFLTEIIQQVGDAELHDRLTAAVEAELAGGAA